MEYSLILFRSDLRLIDNPAIHEAVKNSLKIIPVFIYDGENLGAASKLWLKHSLASLNESLKDYGSELLIHSYKSNEKLLEFIKTINDKFQIKEIFWNRRYEPKNIEKDTELKKLLNENAFQTKSFCGNLLIEPWEIFNKQGKPYQVYTSYWKQYHEYLLTDFKDRAIPCEYSLNSESFISIKEIKSIQSESISDLNLITEHQWEEKCEKYISAGEKNALAKLNKFSSETKAVLNYGSKRDLPSIQGTSQLSPHLHFGEISPRQIWTEVNKLESPLKVDYLKQIIWREFAHYLLYHFPHTENEPLKADFKRFNWEDCSKPETAELLKVWQKGLTGFPIVDAGMRELWETGWMHNRVRMIVASFLVKDLRIHWLEGANWFNDTLFDADLANNIMGWQWVAGSGADASPYFRIFNPERQSEKFDPDASYIRKWVPELAKLSNKYIHAPEKAPSGFLRAANIELGKDYPLPMVDHALAREIALNEFKKLKDKATST
ncbi:MAG: deoxyribodipyrimidine photo-lyase [Candidatus Caenarcaniphilales bacterium]|nr:deoxyribodipyrimidine photo-lyase [Candidatus Caenarcaniphilales bacterium]